MKDARGKQSRTLVFVSVAFAAVTLKFLVGGMELPGLGPQPEVDVSAYGSAALMIIGTWVAREWKDKSNA